MSAIKNPPGPPPTKLTITVNNHQTTAYIKPYLSAPETVSLLNCFSNSNSSDDERYSC